VPEKYKETMEFIRTLYDFPKSTKETSQIEMYWQAHPTEISDPVDIMSCLREAKMIPKP
jgi:hypothetical protein